MDIIATEPHPARIEAGPSVLLHARMVGFGPGTATRNLDVEVVTSSPLLPTDRKWAIRFNADGTATIILGMKDYGRGWFSSYFTSVAAARLGIPFRRFRVYYSATSPAVLQTPVPSATGVHRSHIGPVANAVVDIIEGMCDRVIEKGRSTFAGPFARQNQRPLHRHQTVRSSSRSASATSPRPSQAEASPDRFANSR